MEQTNYCHERRKSPRLTAGINTSCIESQNDNKSEAVTHDISKEGVGLISEAQLNVGSNVEIYLRMMDTGEIIATRGKIVWFTHASKNKYRVGIQLEQPQLEPIPLALRTIRSQIQQRFSGKSPAY